MVKDGLNAEQVERQKMIAARVEERRRWAEFQRIYERCVAIARATWDDSLETAQMVQDSLAQGMRDRAPSESGRDLSIPVPLFTPRDRQQFIKEVAATLLISADRRNLTALPELPKDAPKEPPEGEVPEAASGTDELSSVEVAPA